MGIPSSLQFGKQYIGSYLDRSNGRHLYLTLGLDVSYVERCRLDGCLGPGTSMVLLAVDCS